MPRPSRYSNRSCHSPSSDSPEYTIMRPIIHDTAYSYGYSHGYTSNFGRVEVQPTLPPRVGEKLDGVHYTNCPLDSSSMWIDLDMWHSSDSTASQEWYDQTPFNLCTTGALFVAATVAAVPMAQYHPTRNRNGGEPYFHSTPSESSITLAQTHVSEQNHGTGSVFWSSLKHHVVTNPSADAFSMATLAFGAACALLCHSNRRSTSQRPLLFIGVSAAVALAGCHRGEGGILWNTTVPVAVITAMLLSRIVDIIYNWLRVSTTDRSVDK